MTQRHEQQAVQTVKNILHVLHEKRYEDLLSCVDGMEWADTGEIREFVQGTLELNDMDAFDEYGAPCNFHPQYEYSHEVEFYEYTDGSGFAAEYDLTSGGELADLRLQLKFLYDGSGLKCIFRTIDPM